MSHPDFHYRWDVGLAIFAQRLGLLEQIDAIETDAFGMAIVQDFDGVAVEDGNDISHERGRERERGNGHERETYDDGSYSKHGAIK